MGWEGPMRPSEITSIVSLRLLSCSPFYVLARKTEFSSGSCSSLGLLVNVCSHEYSN